MPPWLGARITPEIVPLLATCHVAAAVVRRYRTGGGKGHLLLPVPGFLLAAALWLFPTAGILLATLALHAAFWIATEKLVPRAAPAPRGGGKRLPVPPPAVTPSADPARAAAPAPRGFVPVPVLAVFDETSEIRTFRFARPEGFAFVPGQFVTVRTTVKGAPATRCYSVSSAPESTGWFEISVRRQGSVSGALHSTLRPGATLEVKAPAGPFVYPPGPRPLVLLAGGVGITPLASMLRHAVLAEPGRPVTLVLSVRTEADVPFRQELSLLARRHPQLRVVVTLSRGTSAPGFLAGRIDEALLRKVVPEPGAAAWAICGPGGMIQGCRDLLGRMGVPPAQVHSEAFEAAVASSLAAGPAGSEPCNIRLTLSRRTVTALPGQTILEAAEEGGVEIPSSCRSGVCHTCRCRLVSGQVDAPEGLLPPDDERDGWFLPCVARVKTDCVVEA